MYKLLCCMMLCACCRFSAAAEPIPAVDTQGNYEDFWRLLYRQVRRYPDLPDRLILESLVCDVFWLQYARSQTRKLMDNMALKEGVSA